MKKILILILAIGFVTFTGCQKNETVKVSYFVTNSNAGFTAAYLDENGLIQTTYIPTQSRNDKKTIYTFPAEPGEIVYLSVTDTAILSFVKVYIFMDGKIYKESTRTDDNTMPVTVSGTVPY